MIAFASKSLSKTQRRYCVTKKELLAVVYFVGTKFRHYLGPEDNFLIRTDHASLKWLMTSFCADEGMIGRWLEILSRYHFTIEHRKGAHHLNADALSRIPSRPCPRKECPECHPSESDMDVDVLTAVQGLVCSATVSSTYPAQSSSSGDGPYPERVEYLENHERLPERGDDTTGWTRDALHEYQQEDSDIRRFMEWVETYQTHETRPSKELITPETKEQKVLLSLWGEFVIKHGVLYRIPSDWHHGLHYVVPMGFRKQVLYYVHRNIAAGHMGVYRTTNAAVRRFYWPNMRADIQLYVHSCLRCEMTKPGPGKGKAPLVQELSGFRNERIAFDIANMPLTPDGYQHILCIGDYFSKYFVVVPLKTHTAPVVANAILEHWICKLGGCPVTIHSDRGPEFRSHVVKHIFEMLEIHQTFTTPYRPQSDGFVERFNRTIKQMLASKIGYDSPLWKQYLPYCLMAYNATTQALTGCTPNMLCFGEELTLPVDIMFGTGRESRPWIRPDEVYALPWLR